ncbi:hypothetical protein [Candidatus Mesenet endosymbiont of Agriotes lineatus]|uniref:hypothetical protein n=1 Tax=Candidatus Mesenet endosymbiont of Agriotes lineatus TaxID=3077948 RepID=UPI0030CF59B4
MLVDVLKQAIAGDDHSSLDLIIEQGIQKIDNRNDFRRGLYNFRLPESDTSIQKNLSILLASFLNEECIEAILKNKGLLDQLKGLEAELKVEKIDFFTVVAGVVKEKRLLDKILTSQDVEQIYVKCLRGDYSHPMFGLLETAAIYNNVEFIDVFLNRVEQDIQNKVEQTKQLTRSQGSLNSLESDSGISSDNESDVDSTDNSINKLSTNPDKPNLPSDIFTKQKVLEGLTTNLVNVLSTAISMEAYETVNYLYDKFNKTDSIEIKEAFIIALEHDEVKKEYEKQQTERPNSVKVIKLMKEWYIECIQLKLQTAKDNIDKLERIDSCKNPEDFKEKIEATYLSLNGLKNGVISTLQTAVDKKDYGLIKNLSDNFNVQSIDIRDVFDKVLENEDIQKAIKNSKKIKRILCNDEQSILKMMEELVLKIKNLIEQIINYLSKGKDIKKQSSTVDLSTLPSSHINSSSVHSGTECVDAVMQTM